MSRWSKRFKKYERHFLLGLVVILLLTFSVGGAFSCQSEGQGGPDYSGSFLVTPSQRETVDAKEFVTTWHRYDPFRYNVRTPSLSFLPPKYAGGLPRWFATWIHLMPVDAAYAAGYRCGEEYQLQAAIRKAVQYTFSGLEFNDEVYRRFLREFYRAGASQFQDTIREIVIKDEFLRPLIETPRYAIGYEEAYEVWKRQFERVNLEYVALRGDDFALPALRRETTRRRIGQQLEMLTEVANTCRALEGLQQRLEMWRDAHEGILPETLAELGEAGEPKDVWGNVIRYVSSEGDLDLVSAGPDGAFDSSDDVTLDTVRQVRTRAALRNVGDAVVRWHEAISAWPTELDAMRTAPKEGALAPLRGSADDAWGKPLVYERAEDDLATPRLFSAGPDGEPGTDDDVYAVVNEERVLVPPGIAFIPFLADDDKDAWDRPLVIDFAQATNRGWTVTSAAKDGVSGTADDLDTGNEAEILAFFGRPEVHAGFVEPTKREFEAIYVHLPLVPDEVLARLWEAWPQYHPDEQTSFDRWRQLHDYSYYMGEDPADLEEGHGAEHSARVAPGHEPTLVPDAAIFGDLPKEFVDSSNPDAKAYVEKKWRNILLRETFLEHLLNGLLTQARESQDAVRAWEEKKKAFDEQGDEQGGEEEAPGPCPEEVTFESLLADVVGPFQPGEGEAPWLGYFRTEKPLERTEWETLPHIGHMNLTTNMQRVTKDGQYAPIPIVVNDSHTKAIVRNLKFRPERQKELEEVYDDVFDRYLERKRLDIAEEKLRALRDAVREADEPGELPDVWKTAFDAWIETLGVPCTVEETGWFIGVRPPRARDVGEEVEEEESVRIRARDFVRTTGYVTVRAGVAPDEDLKPGTLGRSILRDDDVNGSDSVFLVRMQGVRFPPPEAFSPRDYADYITFRILGRPFGVFGMSASGGERQPGLQEEALRHYFFDFDWMKKAFELVTPHEPVPEAPR